MARGQGTVVVRVLGEIRDLTGKLRQGAAEIGQFGYTARNLLDDLVSNVTSRFGRVGYEAQKGFERMADSATAAGSTAGVAAAGGVAALAAGIAALGVQGVKSFVDLTHKVRELQRVTGAGAEDASALVAVMDDVGVSVEQGAASFFRFSRNINTNEEALKKHGIAIVRNRDGSVDLFQTLLNVADAYNRVGGGVRGNQIAFDAFGRSGAALIPLLVEGRDRLAELYAEADKHGEIVSQSDIDRGREFELALDDLGDAVGGLERALGQGLIPALTDLANGATVVIDTTNRLARPLGGIKGIVQGIINTVNPAAAVMGLFGKKSKDAGDDAASAASGIDTLSDAAYDSEDAFDAATEAAGRLDKSLGRLQDSMFGVQDAQDAVNRDFEDLEQQADDFAERRIDAQERLADAQVDAARRVRDAEEALAEARKDLNDLAGGPEDAAEYMRRYLTGQSGMTDEIADATKRVRDAEENLADARKDSAESIEDAKKAVGELIRKEGDARRAAREQRDEIKQIPEDIKKVVAEMEREKRPQAEILGYIETQRNRLGEIKGILSENKGILGETVELLKQYEAFLKFTGAISDSGGSIRQQADRTREGAANAADLITRGVVNNNTFNISTSNPEEAAVHVVQRLSWSTGFGGR